MPIKISQKENKVIFIYLKDQIIQQSPSVFIDIQHLNNYTRKMQLAQGRLIRKYIVVVIGGLPRANLHYMGLIKKRFMRCWSYLRRMEVCR